MESQARRRSTCRLLYTWLPAVLWLGMMVYLSLQSADVAARLLSMVGRTAAAAVNAMLKEGLTAHGAELVGVLACYGVVFIGFGGLAFFFLMAFRASGLGPRSSLALSFALCLLTAVAQELMQIFIPGRMPRISECVINTSFSLAVLVGTAVFQWAWEKFPKILNRETVSYVLFGVLTTLVNIFSYLPLYKALTQTGMADPVVNIISNTTAWVLSVLFAYVTNKLFVFRSKTVTAAAAWREFLLFVGARLASYGVDMAGMLLLVNGLHIHNGIAKIVTNVMVMIMNYFFSKLFIFNKEKKAHKGIPGE